MKPTDQTVGSVKKPAKPLSQTPSAIKARAYRAAEAERRRLGKEAFNRAKQKLTPEEWDAVAEYFDREYNYYY